MLRFSSTNNADIFNNASPQINKHFLSCPVRFDLAVNGGGAVTLQFQRSPLRAATRTTSLPWNAVVTVNPVVSLGSIQGDTSR